MNSSTLSLQKLPLPRGNPNLTPFRMVDRIVDHFGKTVMTDILDTLWQPLDDKGKFVSVQTVFSNCRQCIGAALLPYRFEAVRAGPVSTCWLQKAFPGVYHGEHEFSRGNCHIDGIESFWSYAKRRLAKFNGVPQKTFLLHLKECEFRFNHRAEDLFDRILTLLKENPL